MDLFCCGESKSYLRLRILREPLLRVSTWLAQPASWTRTVRPSWLGLVDQLGHRSKLFQPEK